MAQQRYGSMQTAQKRIEVWFVAASVVLFLLSLVVHQVARSVFPVEEAMIEEPHVPLPAGPRKFQ